MKEQIKYDHQLDLRGLDCVSPIVRLNKELKQFAADKVIEVITNDPTAMVSISAWARTSGSLILETLCKTDEARFYVKRVK